MRGLRHFLETVGGGEFVTPNTNKIENYGYIILPPSLTFLKCTHQNYTGGTSQFYKVYRNCILST